MTVVATYTAYTPLVSSPLNPKGYGTSLPSRREDRGPYKRSLSDKFLRQKAAEAWKCESLRQLADSQQKSRKEHYDEFIEDDAFFIPEIERENEPSPRVCPPEETRQQQNSKSRRLSPRLPTLRLSDPLRLLGSLAAVQLCAMIGIWRLLGVLEAMMHK